MKKFLTLFITTLVLFSTIVTFCPAEEPTDVFFPLAQGIYKPGTKFFDGDPIVILPGQGENIQTGSVFKIYVKDTANSRIEVGSVTVKGVNVWESNAVLALGDDVEFITDSCEVKVPVLREKALNHWLSKGAAFEKSKVYFDAFCCYYRATVYVPNDKVVYTSYLRNGYLHYLGEAMKPYRSKDYKTAYEALKVALSFRGVGVDTSEGEAALRICEVYLSRSFEYNDLVEDAKKAQANGDMEKALKLYHRAWLRFASIFPKDKVSRDFKAMFKNEWPKFWNKAVADSASGDKSAGFEALLKTARYAHLLDATTAETVYNHLRMKEKALPEKCVAKAIMGTQKYLASLQTPEGFFGTSNKAQRSSKTDIITGLTLAFYAKAGNTRTSGIYKDQVNKVFAWMKKTINERGALEEGQRRSEHIFLTYGLSVLFSESADPEVGAMLSKAIEFLEEKQLKEGFFGQSVNGMDRAIDTAVAAMAFRNCWDSGATFPEDSLVFEKLYTYAMSCIDLNEKVLKDANGQITQNGSAQQIISYGGILSTIMAAGKSIPSNENITFVMTSRDFKLDKNNYTPEGWFANTWLWRSKFKKSDWEAYYNSIRDFIGSKTEFDAEDPTYFYHPTSRTGIARTISQPGIAAFNGLTLMLTLETRTK